MRSLGICFILIGLSAQALAATQADTSGGESIARRSCSNCHDTSGKTPPASPPGGAPPFITVAQSQETTDEKLQKFLRLPHGRMNNILLTDHEIDEVVEYILSLKKE